jgi:hypothetical protein
MGEAVGKLKIIGTITPIKWVLDSDRTRSLVCAIAKPPQRGIAATIHVPGVPIRAAFPILPRDIPGR